MLENDSIAPKDLVNMLFPNIDEMVQVHSKYLTSVLTSLFMVRVHIK